MACSARRTVAAAAITSLAIVAVVADACPTTGGPPDSARAEPTAAPTLQGNAPTVIAYYFHQTLRCHTCLTIEAYAQDTLETHFADALADGRLVWRPLNVEEEDNKHFAEDFELEANSLILAQTVAGKVVAWQDLPAIWDFVDDKDRFCEYVRTNVGTALPGKIDAASPGEP